MDGDTDFVDLDSCVEGFAPSPPPMMQRHEDTHDKRKVGHEKTTKNTTNGFLGTVQPSDDAPQAIPPVPPSKTARYLPPAIAPLPLQPPPPPPPPAPSSFSSSPVIRHYNDILSLDSGHFFAISAIDCLYSPTIGCITVSNHSQPRLHIFRDIIAAGDYRWVHWDGNDVGDGRPGKVQAVAVDLGRATSGELDILQQLGACYCIIVQAEIERDIGNPSYKSHGW
ncbi:hypothetical protein LTR66_004579 [Elasticomyces elasticus]|nr:hypothetical protein LTR66_004579 [Elasticomyces elasticus]